LHWHLQKPSTGEKESKNQPVTKVTMSASHSGGGIIVGTAPMDDQYCDSEQPLTEAAIAMTGIGQQHIVVTASATVKKDIYQQSTDR